MLFLFLVMVSGTGCGTMGTTEGSGAYLDDSVITAKVKTALFKEATLNPSPISVETLRGTVQLSGIVRSQKEMNRAVQLAHEVPGVTSVMNDMRFK